MDAKLEEFSKLKGLDAAHAAVESYKQQKPEFDAAWTGPMLYASGFTARRLGTSISEEWIAPLKRQVRMAGLSALAALGLLGMAMFYVWSLISFSSFALFLAAFAPAVAALLLSVAKSYKAWAEAKKHLAEAKAMSTSVSTQK